MSYSLEGGREGGREGERERGRERERERERGERKKCHFNTHSTRIKHQPIMGHYGIFICYAFLSQLYTNTHM